MSDDLKRRLLALLLLLAVLTALIAAAIPDFKFEPGVPLPDLPSSTGSGVVEPAPAVASSLNDLAKAILILFIALTTSVVAYSLLKESSWKEIARTSLAGAGAS